jgi:hypothetical protein
MVIGRDALNCWFIALNAGFADALTGSGLTVEAHCRPAWVS